MKVNWAAQCVVMLGRWDRTVQLMASEFNWPVNGSIVVYNLMAAHVINRLLPFGRKYTSIATLLAIIWLLLFTAQLRLKHLRLL